LIGLRIRYQFAGDHTHDTESTTLLKKVEFNG